MKQRGLVILIATAALEPAYVAAAVQPAHAQTAQVPYVGCESDGQLGPQPAPRLSTSPLRLPTTVAARVAYYASLNNGVLAPRGWHCFSLYGSSGSVVFVTPDAIGRRRIFEPTFKFKGEVVEFGYTLGGTSGRFEVAEISSRLFPVARSFVNTIAKEQKDIGGPPLNLANGGSPNDQIVRRSDTVVRFVTSAGHEGLGTRSRLAANASPIAGLAALVKDDGDLDLIELNVRLAPKDRDLVSVIQSLAQRNHGAPLTDKPPKNRDR